MVRCAWSVPFLAFATACAEMEEDPNWDADESVFSKQPFDVVEQQPTIDLNVALAIYPELEGQNLIQTFSVDKNRWELGYVELPASCVDGTLLNIKIREGIDGTVLYEANHNVTGPLTGDFNLFQVYNPDGDGPIRLRKNTEYAIELQAFGPATCGIVGGPDGDTYDGGAAWYRVPENANVWLPFPGDDDLPFTALMR